MAELDLQLGPSHEALGPTYSVAGFSQAGAPPRASSEEDTLKRQTGKVPEPC